jgi:hypothetical protein
MLVSDLHNKCFVTTENTAGLSSAQTIFQYQLNGDLITGHYSGGTIRAGQLLGRVLSATTIELHFHCLTVEGALLAGCSTGSVSRDEQGLLCLTFDWAWLTGEHGGGVSRYVELSSAVVAQAATEIAAC